MTIVELPNDTEKTFILLYDDGGRRAHIWGVAEVSAMEKEDWQANGRWCVTITNDGSIVGFMYADAIRMMQ